MPHPFINGRGASKAKIRRVRPDAKVLDSTKKEKLARAAAEAPPKRPEASMPAQLDPTPVVEAAPASAVEEEPAPDSLLGQTKDLITLDEEVKFVSADLVDDPEPGNVILEELAPDAAENTPEPTAGLDFSVLDGGIKALEKALDSGEWDDHLGALLKAEEANKDRKGAKGRIQERQELLAEAE
jgi:hypothetical protein